MSGWPTPGGRHPRPLGFRGRGGGPPARSALNTPFGGGYDDQNHPGGWISPGAGPGLHPIPERFPSGRLGNDGWRTGYEAPEEYVGLPPQPGLGGPYQDFGYDEWGGGRTPFHTLPRDLQLDPDPTWGRGSSDWYAYPGEGPGGIGAGTGRPFGDLPRPFIDDDSIQARLKWRDEMLNGDPEKAMADHTNETSTLVISFITRGPPSHPHGQGDELLFFRPRRKDPTKQQYLQDLRAPWTFLAIDASPILPLGSTDPIPTSAELSHDSIQKVLPLLDVGSDLRLVRKSKPLRWDETTMLESYLYRLAEGKEDLESEAYRELEIKLGHGMHYWTQLNGFHGAIESDVVSTAMIAVCLPTALSGGIDNIFADQQSRSDQLASQALDVLYLCVQAGYARDAFRHYPIPPVMNGKEELEVVLKRRMYAYWSEVAAWHICRIRPTAEVSVTFSMSKVLGLVRDSVDDPKIKIDDLEKFMVNAIAAEADRSRNAGRQLVREGVAEILYNPAFQSDKPTGDPMLEHLHIVTTSSASTVYGVLAKLITHVLSRKGSPGPSSTIQRRIMDLRITIGESRPLNEGVALAMGLSEVITSFTNWKEKTAEINRRASEPPGISDLGPSALDNAMQAKLREMMFMSMSPLRPAKDGSNAMSPGTRSQVLGLSHLLAELDSKKEVRNPKVTIEVVTDAALPSIVIASGSAGKRPIVLLGAERVLSNGDIVNKVGSIQAAWAGKVSGGSVLVLSRGDRIHPSNLPPPGKPENPGSELVGGWKVTLGVEKVEGFVESPHVTILNPTYDEGVHEHISGYITDLGFMRHEMLLEFTKLQGDMARAAGLTAN